MVLSRFKIAVDVDLHRLFSANILKTHTVISAVVNKITHKNKVFIKTLSYILLVRPATRRMKKKWIRIKRTVRLRCDVRPGTCRMKKKWSHRQAIKQALKHSSKQRVRIKRKSLKMQSSPQN